MQQPAMIPEAPPLIAAVIPQAPPFAAAPLPTNTNANPTNAPTTTGTSTDGNFLKPVPRLITHADSFPYCLFGQVTSRIKSKPLPQLGLADGFTTVDGTGILVNPRTVLTATANVAHGTLLATHVVFELGFTKGKGRALYQAEAFQEPTRQHRNYTFVYLKEEVKGIDYTWFDRVVFPTITSFPLPKDGETILEHIGYPVASKQDPDMNGQNMFHFTGIGLTADISCPPGAEPGGERDTRNRLFSINQGIHEGMEGSIVYRMVDNNLWLYGIQYFNPYDSRDWFKDPPFSRCARITPGTTSLRDATINRFYLRNAIDNRNLVKCHNSEEEMTVTIDDVPNNPSSSALSARDDETQTPPANYKVSTTTIPTAPPITMISTTNDENDHSAVSKLPLSDTATWEVVSASQRRGFPYCLVGLVEVNYGNARVTITGTGTLIDPQRVVTAAHVVDREARGLMQSITFRPGYSHNQTNPEPFGSYTGISILRPTQLDESNIQDEFDFAFITLDRPVAIPQIDAFLAKMHYPNTGYFPAPTKPSMSIITYPTARNGPKLDKYTMIRANSIASIMPRYLLAHDLPFLHRSFAAAPTVFPGSSGGLYIQLHQNTGYRVLGIKVATCGNPATDTYFAESVAQLTAAALDK